MPFIVLTFDGREVHRQELAGTITVGRSSECDICVRDIQLSRRHCRIELTLDGWAVEDLGSKNGTFAAGRRVGRQRLDDGDDLRIGRTHIRFFAGEYVEPKRKATPAPNRSQRPADPFEAMAGTVAAFEYVDAPGELVGATTGSGPALAPRPRPADPRGYAREDLYSLLSSIASSSWDSIYATASRPIETEKLPAPVVRQPGARQRELIRQELHLSLQAHPHHARETETPTTTKVEKPARRRWIAVALVWAAAVGLAAWELLLA